MFSTKNSLQKLDINQVSDLSKFVVSENFKHHSGSPLKEGYEKDIKSISKEEHNFFENSQIFVAKDEEGAIKGSIRVLRWNYIDVLPIEKMFGINPLLVCDASKVNNIYHIGRFAINKKVKDLSLLKKLIVCAIAPICRDKNNIVFAECDSKLVRILTLFGIKTKTIGKSIDYLGSETIPILMDYEGLIAFYEMNKGLVLNTDLLQKENSVLLPVLNRQIVRNTSIV